MPITNTYENEANSVDFFCAKLETDGGGSNATNAQVGVYFSRGAYYKTRMLFNVDISDIPKSARVVNATIALNCNEVNGSGSDKVFCQLLTETWTKDSGSLPSWDNKASGTAWPTAGGTMAGDRILDLGAFPSGTGSVEYDLSWLASIAHRKHGGDFNFILYSNLDSVENVHNVQFNSCENSSNKPVLTITYVEGNASLGKTRTNVTKRNRRNRKNQRKIRT